MGLPNTRVFLFSCGLLTTLSIVKITWRQNVRTIEKNASERVRQESAVASEDLLATVPLVFSLW